MGACISSDDVSAQEHSVTPLDTDHTKESCKNSHEPMKPIEREKRLSRTLSNRPWQWEKRSSVGSSCERTTRKSLTTQSATFSSTVDGLWSHRSFSSQQGSSSPSGCVSSSLGHENSCALLSRINSHIADVPTSSSSFQELPRPNANHSDDIKKEMAPGEPAINVLDLELDSDDSAIEEEEGVTMVTCTEDLRFIS